MVCKWWSSDLNPGSPIPKAILLGFVLPTSLKELTSASSASLPQLPGPLQTFSFLLHLVCWPPWLHSEEFPLPPLLDFFTSLANATLPAPAFSATLHPGLRSQNGPELAPPAFTHLHVVPDPAETTHPLFCHIWPCAQVIWSWMSTVSPKSHPFQFCHNFSHFVYNPAYCLLIIYLISFLNFS